MKRRKQNHFILILVLLVLGIGLGYALLSQDLMINGITKVKGNEWDIHFDNVQISSGSVALSSGDSSASIDSNNNTLVNYTITLNKPGDFYEFTVDAVNDGTIDGMVESVTSKFNGTVISTTNPLPSYLDYSVKYLDGVPIASNHLLEVGATETYRVRLEFKRDISNSELPTTLQTHTFSFGVGYVQADNQAAERPVGTMLQSALSYYEQWDMYDYDSSKTFRTYNNSIKTITFETTMNPPANVIESWDVSELQNGMVMAYLTQNATDNTMYDLTIQGDGSIYANTNSSYWFSDFYYLDSINNIEALNTSKVTNMSYMFEQTGFNSNTFTLDLGNNFDTSNVTNMHSMFCNTGDKSTIFTLDLGDNFDTSKVTDMSYMFSDVGRASTVFTLDLGDKFDTSNVTNMNSMFHQFAYNTSDYSGYSLDLGNKFDTSKVTDMSYMFFFSVDESSVENEVGNHTYNLNLGDKFDTSNVVDMSQMFSDFRINSLDLGDKFDTSNVTNMSYMFSAIGIRSTTFTLDLGDKFDTSNVTNMIGMFASTGYHSTVFTLDLGNEFDTSNVTSMWDMFKNAGYSNPNFTLDLGDYFDTSKVTEMRCMFQNIGYANTTFELDLSTVVFGNPTRFDNMFDGFRNTNKVWVKNASDQSWVIARNSSVFNTSNVLIKGA